MWDLVPWPGIEPRPPALEAWSLSHQTTRDIPKFYCILLYLSSWVSSSWCFLIISLFFMTWDFWNLCILQYFPQSGFLWCFLMDGGYKFKGNTTEMKSPLHIILQYLWSQHNLLLVILTMIIWIAASVRFLLCEGSCVLSPSSVPYKWVRRPHSIEESESLVIQSCLTLRPHGL